MANVYIVWAFDDYYPLGPSDLKGVFSTKEAAQNFLYTLSGYDNYRITTAEVVEESDAEVSTLPMDEYPY